MAQDRLTMTFLFCRPYDIIIWAGHAYRNWRYYWRLHRKSGWRPI